MEDEFNIIHTEQKRHSFEYRHQPSYDRCEFHESTTSGLVSSPFVTIESSARRVIYDHINWGTNDRTRQKEKAGLLIGEVVVDPSQIGLPRLSMSNLNVIATHAIPGKESHSSEVSVEMNFSAWNDLLQEADSLKKMLGDPFLRTVGWYHTHPNELQIFFSEPDRDTQVQLFGKLWQIGVVLNPNTQQWGVFHGKDSAPCRGIMVDCSGFECDFQKRMQGSSSTSNDRDNYSRATGYSGSDGINKSPPQSFVARLFKGPKNNNPT